MVKNKRILRDTRNEKDKKEKERKEKVRVATILITERLNFKLATQGTIWDDRTVKICMVPTTSWLNIRNKSY